MTTNHLTIFLDIQSFLSKTKNKEMVRAEITPLFNDAQERPSVLLSVHPSIHPSFHSFFNKYLLTYSSILGVVKYIREAKISGKLLGEAQTYTRKGGIKFGAY